MLQNNLILDFNLYLCEKFGYRNSCSVMQNANGFCVDIRERDLDCYIRFWEYSCGRGNFPDWSIIIVRSNFKKNQAENLKDLARFFKEYMPRYGYRYLCTEGDDYKYYQTLDLKLIHRDLFEQEKEKIIQFVRKKLNPHINLYQMRVYADAFRIQPEFIKPLNSDLSLG